MVRGHVPVTKVRGFEARRALDIYAPPDGYGCGWWQAAARRSREGDRSCAAMSVRLTFDSKFCHRTGIARSEGRGQGQSNKLCLAGRGVGSYTVGGFQPPNLLASPPTCQAAPQHCKIWKNKRRLSLTRLNGTISSQ